MASAGVELLVPMEKLAVVGIAEVLAHLGDLWRQMGLLKKALSERRPDALVLVDFPDFNFRLARYARKLGIPVVYYITPQVWAWRQGRTEFLKQNVDLALVIFPFEEAFLRQRGVEAHFVGHPLVDTAKPASSLDSFLERHGLAPTSPRVALLPGSRPSEVKRNLPPMMGAARLLAERFPDLAILVPWAGGLPEQLRRPYLDLPVRWIEGEYMDVLGHAHAAAVASGTATLEAALMGVPEVIVYRLKVVTHAIARRMVHLDDVGLPNVVLGRRALPELIQNDFSAGKLADELAEILGDAEGARRRSAGIAEEIRSRLGSGNASARAARELLDFLEGGCRANQR